MFLLLVEFISFEVRICVCVCVDKLRGVDSFEKASVMMKLLLFKNGIFQKQGGASEATYSPTHKITNMNLLC